MHVSLEKRKKPRRAGYARFSLRVEAESATRRLTVSFPVWYTFYKWTFLAGFCIQGGPMKKSKFSESQIVAILKEGEAGVPVAQILRKHGISHATFYKAAVHGKPLQGQRHSRPTTHRRIDNPAR
jgi:hypothetical protein